MNSIQNLIGDMHKATPKPAAPVAPKPTSTAIHTMYSVTKQDSDTVATRLALPPGLCLLFDDLSGNEPGGKWLTTSAAVFYCMDRTGRTDLEWNSILMENRRDQHDIASVMSDRRPRGNAARIGLLPFFRHGNKVYYRVSDLNAWLAQLPKSMRIH